MSGVGRRLAAPVTVVVLTVALTGCSPDIRPSLSPSPTDVPLPTPVTATYLLQATAWYAGLIIHVDSATAVLRAGVGSVTVDLRIENPGANPASLDAPLRLTSGGQVVEPVPGTTLPGIDAGGSSAARVQFDVEAGFDVNRAAIRIGRPSYHQAVLPLVRGPQSVVSLEPLALTVGGRGQAGNLLVTLRGVELRADLPDWSVELPPDTLALSVTYDARYTGSFSGGFAFTSANISLVLPDGRKVVARADGHSAPAVLIGAGQTMAGLASRFDVPEPGIGNYALEVRDGTSTKRLPLTVAGT